jgi:hypothetical protein
MIPVDHTGGNESQAHALLSPSGDHLTELRPKIACTTREAAARRAPPLRVALEVLGR